MINGKHGQGTHSTKMGADKSAEYMYPKCPEIYLPKPKSLGFGWKKTSLGVRVLNRRCSGNLLGTLVRQSKKVSKIKPALKHDILLSWTLVFEYHFLTNGTYYRVRNKQKKPLEKSPKINIRSPMFIPDSWVYRTTRIFEWKEK